MVFAHKNDKDYNPNQLFLHLDWEPNSNTVPIELRARVSYFLKCLCAQYRRRQVTSNLTPFQKHLLAQFLDSNEYQVFPLDKNLGPCVNERTEYINRTLAHLSDASTHLRTAVP
jgi:hypothetical protein